MSKERKRRQRRVTSREPTQPSSATSPAGRTGELEPSVPVEPAPIPPALWRTNLERLRSEFMTARERHGPLSCSIFQTTTSAIDPRRPPFARDGVAHLPRRCSYSELQESRTSEGKPIYVTDPIVDAEGRPFVDSEGRYVLCAMPTLREWHYLGQSGTGRWFVELAERAGGALFNAPVDTVSWIPKDTLSADKDEPRWIWAIFDLAWRGIHPSLHAERKIWVKPSKPCPDFPSEIAYLPYDVMQLRALREAGPVYDFPEAWCERLPGFFVSELPDVYTASVDLIDMLLASVPGTAGEEWRASPPSQDIQSSTPANSSDTQMNATDLRVLRTLAEMARGLELEMSLVDRTPPEAADSSTGPPDPKSQLVSRTLQFDGKIPDLLLRLELRDIEDAIEGALVALLGRGLITSCRGELALRVGSYVFRTSKGMCHQLVVQASKKSARVGRLVISVSSETDGMLMDMGSMMPAYAVTPRGWEVAEKLTGPSDVPKGVTEPPDDAELRGEWNALAERQRDCLRALLLLRAFDAPSRQRTEDIAVKAEGRDANVNGFKGPLARLVRRDLAERKIGREGGYWLNSRGRELLTVVGVVSPGNAPSS